MLLRGANRLVQSGRGLRPAAAAAAASGVARMSGGAPAKDGIRVTYITPEGSKIETVGQKGDSLLRLAHKYDIDLEGACEESCACSTCHLIVLDEDKFNKMPEASDEENDMLDLAFGLTDTSRLGCQVKLDDYLDGLVVQIPSATRNMAVDGFKPKPH